MSIVIATPDHYGTIRRTVEHLREQTVRHWLEVVIVVPSEEALDLDDSALDGFLQVSVVEAGEIKSIAFANAAGIRRASAPIVVLAEDHSFPDRGWAEALLQAHQKPWAAVGPVVRNANPDSMVSWANFLISYAPWLDPTPAGVVEHLPGHNSSYKRSVLLDYGPALETMLEAESVLHWDLGEKGYELYLESAAKISHLNFESFAVWIREQFASGRAFAAARSRRWSSVRRMAYIGAGPLIPLVRLRRILQELLGPGRPRQLLPNVLPALFVGLTLSALGEAIGYAWGEGDAAKELSRWEFHRIRHVASRD